ncbi:ATP-dependent helicase HrpB [Lacibacterium aquatile]|uniref:ATP-dependent helicase HrpB n=1 Tax=Lacibacterium aquatile TaxID=1168082 RepID=A0ABW5DN96_9PROT
MDKLPIEPVIPALLNALASAGRAVLQAPPGAGKTTRVPLALLDAPWRAGGKIIVLEPRRLAARSAALRMATTLGEEVGETVGYRVRLDSRIGPKTIIEVMTEGLFLRRLQSDPSLDGVAGVLFDEFHERSVDGDLALAFCLESRAALRDDLRLLVMSATLDGEAVARHLDDAPIITSEGRAFPVEIRHLPRPDRLEPAMAAAIRQALNEVPEGDILAFLPGGAEIRRTADALVGLPPTIDLTPLHGDLPLAEQDRAIKPAPTGRRKVVLATSIAETSLTIEGVRVVIDSGLSRVARFDPNSSMGRLETVRVSLAAAEQRRGRAGRVAPGVCYRLWPEAETRALLPFHPPAILEADLTPLALELAVWSADSLPWLTPPPSGTLSAARELLNDLGALDEGRVTTHGKAMSELGAHPRLAHLMLTGAADGYGATACLLGALLSERDPLRGPMARDTDLGRRVDLLRGEETSPALDRGAAARIREQAKAFRRQLDLPAQDRERSDGELIGRLVALAYPDRIAQRRGPPGQFRLSGGRGASLPPEDPLAANEFLAVAAIDGQKQTARIFLAAPVSRAGLEADFPERLAERAFVEWDEREKIVQARRQIRLGALILSDKPLTNPGSTDVAAAVMAGIRRHGLALLPWNDTCETLRQRVAFARRYDSDQDWPDLGDEALLSTLEEWLAPHLDGISRATHFSRIDLFQALSSLMPWPLPARLDKIAPTHLSVPSGSRIPIDYSGEEPVLAVRLQEMFGLATTPSVAEGRVPVLLHLLSPARRPVQVTRDLAGFWRGAYAEVRKDLRGQYPKHYWPDNPLEAEATARTKKHMGKPTPQ